MKSAIAIAFGAAVAGVAAHPSGAHAHRHMHRSVNQHEAREFVMAHRPPPPKPTTTKATTTHTTTTSKAAPPPTTTTTESEAPATSSASAKPSSGSSSDYIPFCGGKKKRATAAEIAYKGNTGGGTGCNLMTVPESIADQYDYVTEFKNDGGDDLQCDCWNKIGPKGLINGFFTGNQAITFDLAAGGNAFMVADGNSQGGCCCGKGGCPLTNIGQFAGTWYEFDAGNESNGKHSGADASCLVSAAAGIHIPAMKVCDDSTCSTINAGGTGKNAYLGGMEALDGVGLNLNPGQFRITVTVS